jgi:hypothetical protein
MGAFWQSGNVAIHIARVVIIEEHLGVLRVILLLRLDLKVYKVRLPDYCLSKS